MKNENKITLNLMQQIINTFSSTISPCSSYRSWRLPSFFTPSRAPLPESHVIPSSPSSQTFGLLSPSAKIKRPTHSEKVKCLLLHGFSLYLIHLLWIPLHNCLLITKTQAGEPLPHPTLCMGILNVVLSLPPPPQSLL